MFNLPIFEKTRVIVSASYIEKMPAVINKAQFFEECCTDLKCTVCQEGEVATYSLEGFWEAVVKAQNVLLSNLEKWNALRKNLREQPNTTEKEGQISSQDKREIDLELVEVDTLSSAGCNREHGEEALKSEHLNRDFNFDRSALECPQSSVLKCPSPVDVVEGKTLCQLEVRNREELFEIPTEKFHSEDIDGPHFQICPSNASMSQDKAAENSNEQVSIEASAENEIYMDIQLEHNYNHLIAKETIKSCPENSETSVENEIYMDIKLDKPNEQIFSNPDLPVTLVVAKEDEPGVEVVQLSMSVSAENSLNTGTGRFPSQSQERIKLRSKKYEEQTPFRYFCSQCSFKTKRHSHMRNHSRFHEKVCKIYSCDQCDFSTIRACHLQRHIGTHKTEVFACSECTYSTHSESLLTKHQRYKHLSKKADESKNDIYQCLQCDYMTSSEKLFERHIAVHTKKQKGKVKPTGFKCNICSYQSPSRSNYYRHLACIHGDKRPFMCTTCGLCFKRSDTLLQHQATHVDKKLGFPCPTCQKYYRSDTALKEHLLTHEDERQFLCEICGASFKTRTAQRKHNNEKHIQIKMHVCTTCSKRFASKYLLKRHMKVHDIPKRRSELSTHQTTIKNNSLQVSLRSEEWDNSLVRADTSSDDVQVIVVHQESAQSDLSIQGRPLFQVASSLVSGQTLSVPLIPVGFVISAPDSEGETCNIVPTSTTHIPSSERELISLTFPTID